MKNKIREMCQRLEDEKGIRMLFAVENGSRAWRMENKDSDYDVRFVFVRPLEDYLRINLPANVINASFDADGAPCTGGIIDMSGFDVFKYARLLASSNPTAIEWITTDIVYWGEQNRIFRDFALQNFNPVAVYYHYKSLCKNNYLTYLKTRKSVTYKKYLYAYRGLVNAKWVAHKKSIPPIIFADALEGMRKNIPADVLKKLREIIRLKSEGKEKGTIQNIARMDGYIENFLKATGGAPTEKPRPRLDGLNEELRRILLSPTQKKPTD